MGPYANTYQKVPDPDPHHHHHLVQLELHALTLEVLEGLKIQNNLFSVCGTPHQYLRLGIGIRSHILIENVGPYANT